MWRSIGGMIEEMKRCEAAEAHVAAVSLAYIYIDTLAFLAMPDTKDRQTRDDFIAWVDTYLKGHRGQPYQYRGIDVYGARCALLHSYGSEADYHKKYPDTHRFGYHDGGRHAFDPAIDPHLVMIGMASFTNDVVHAIGSFLEQCKVDQALRIRAEKRLPKVLAVFPFSQ